jgi:hypothetical protein
MQIYILGIKIRYVDSVNQDGAFGGVVKPLNQLRNMFVFQPIKLRFRGAKLCSEWLALMSLVDIARRHFIICIMTCILWYYE